MKCRTGRAGRRPTESGHGFPRPDAHGPFAAPISGRTGAQLLEAADTAYALAEQEFDRSPETREELDYAYLTAARVLDAEEHPKRASAWLGLATVRRYQKGRRDDALEAFDAALTAGPESVEVWDAYLDYITYAVSAAALLAIVERMPAPIRVRKLPAIVAVGRGTDRWGTMSLDDQQRFTTPCPRCSLRWTTAPASVRS